MKQVLQNLSNGQTRVEEVPAPAEASQRLIVETRRTLISAGTEKMLVEFGKAGWIGKAKAQPEKVKQVLDKIRTDGLLPTLEAVFSKLGEPIPLGYCNAGVVRSVGRNVGGFEVGDRVVSNGPHAEIVSVPPLLCAKIPDNVSDDQAAFTVLASIGLQGIRLAQPTLGETIVVYGLGLIGLITAQLLRANGCHVVGIDINPTRLELAKSWGVTAIHGGECSDLSARIGTLTQGRGADAVLITASAKSDSIVSDAAKMCRRRGRVILIGVVGLNLNRSDFYEKEISFQVSCSYGPGRYDADYEQQGQDYPIGFVRWTEQRNFEAILGMLSAGSIDFLPLITHRIELAQAEAAYTKIQEDPAALGVLLEYSDQPCRDATVHLPGAQTSKGSQVVAAIVGAGNFTRATLMPALAKLAIRKKHVVGRTNTASILHVASKFNVENATTDWPSVLNDQEVNLVLLTTNHDSHARLVCESLAAGKHVFVEKPLAITVDQLSQVLEALRSADGQHLAVGFNRRYSPHVQRCIELLRGRSEPLAMNILVNAGDIPANHWVQDATVGGGRIIGEACHFLDLCVALSGSLIRSVSAHRMGSGPAVRDDKMTISIILEDGSIANICYLANGSKGFPKERITIFSDGRVLEIDNFRQTLGYGFSSFKRLRTSRQEKGHQPQFTRLVERIIQGGKWLIPLEELVNVTLASISAVTSAREERTIMIRDEYDLHVSSQPEA